MSTVYRPNNNQTVEQLERRIKGSQNNRDCCLCGTLCGMDKVNSICGQYLVNRGLNGDIPAGKCGSVKAGCEYLGLVTTCSNVHQPGVSDETAAKCTRCRDCCLFGTFCCPCATCYGLSQAHKAIQQVEIIKGPQKQQMK